MCLISKYFWPHKKNTLYIWRWRYMIHSISEGTWWVKVLCDWGMQYLGWGLGRSPGKSLSLIRPIFHFPNIFLIILSHNLFSNVHVHMCIFRPIELFYHDWVLQLSHSPMVGCNSLYGSNFDFRMTYLASRHPRTKLRHFGVNWVSYGNVVTF